MTSIRIFKRWWHKLSNYLYFRWVGVHYNKHLKQGQYSQNYKFWLNAFYKLNLKIGKLCGCSYSAFFKHWITVNRKDKNLCIQGDNILVRKIDHKQANKQKKEIVFTLEIEGDKCCGGKQNSEGG